MISTQVVIQLLQSAVCFGTVIMFGAIGEILTEKSGNQNLGVPGIMYLGGIAGLAASFFYEFNNPDPNKLVCLLVSFLAAFGAAALAGLACGMWKSREELQELRRSDRVFLPRRVQSECDEEYRLWKRAVSRAADWIEH